MSEQVETTIRVQYPSETSTNRIRDYFLWSLLNIFLGGFFLGFIAVFFSRQTQRYDQLGDLRRAKRFSIFALLCNLFITVVFFSVLTSVVVYLVYFMSYVDE